MNWVLWRRELLQKKIARTINAMSSEGEKLAAVGSRNKERAQDFADKYGIEKAYGSYEELAADPNVDAVYIATPNNLHFENTMLCLNAGKHVSRFLPLYDELI